IKATTVSKAVDQQLDLFSDPVNPQGAEIAVESGFKTIDQVAHLYQHVDSDLSRKLLLEMLLKQERVCFDTETTSLKSLETQLVGCAFSWEAGSGYYMSFPADQQQTKQLLEPFKAFFENPNITKVGQNLKYDIKVLSNYEIKVEGPIFDTMIAHYLIDPDMRHQLD